MVGRIQWSGLVTSLQDLLERIHSHELFFFFPATITQTIFPKQEIYESVKG